MTQASRVRHKHCLLVVDDEPDVCDSVHDLLRREYTVLKASSASQALDLLKTEEVHIIMTDQRMPQASGVDFLVKAKSRRPEAVRMLFTGYADLESIIAAINQGHIFQFLRKPWNPDDLREAVRSAAEEYDRLVAAEEERERLQREIEQLQLRVGNLESEMNRLIQTFKPTESQAPPPQRE